LNRGVDGWLARANGKAPRGVKKPKAAAGVAAELIVSHPGWRKKAQTSTLSGNNQTGKRCLTSVVLCCEAMRHFQGTLSGCANNAYLVELRQFLR